MVTIDPFQEPIIRVQFKDSQILFQKDKLWIKIMTYSMETQWKKISFRSLRSEHKTTKLRGITDSLLLKKWNNKEISKNN